VPPVAEPTLYLAQAKRLMDALYEPGDTFYICAYHDRNKLVWCQSRLTYDDGFSAGVFIQVANGVRQAVATSVGVFEPEEEGRRARRSEDQCVGLSALGIDIDHDDLAALVPGATTVEEVIPEAVRRLEEAGIPPHALVRSGRGLHVYILIERVRFASNEERTRAKDVWFRRTWSSGCCSFGLGIAGRT
jgi:DNA primase